jgi:hypothetical protein
MAQAPSQQIAFAVMDEPATRGTVAVHVNFGVYTGREATLAEIDRLAASLLERVPHVTIVSEVRHEIDRHSEAAVHQVRSVGPGGAWPNEAPPRSRRTL